MYQTVMGIDPGWSGGVAVIGPADIKVQGFCNMTERDIYNTVTEYAMFADVCFIENVHAMPGQGVTSMFKFGHILGFLRACVMASDVPMIDVTPQKWQQAMHCRSKGDKNVTKRRAQELFPKLKITHATADALLIASYGAGINPSPDPITERMFT